MEVDILQFFRDYGSAITAIGALGIGAFIGAVGTWVVGLKDLSLRRRVETLKVFMEISARAHGVRLDGSTNGAGERVPAMFLLADLASRDKWLWPAGSQQLEKERTRAFIDLQSAYVTWLQYSKESRRHGSPKVGMPQEMRDRRVVLLRAALDAHWVHSATVEAARRTKEPRIWWKPNRWWRKAAGTKGVPETDEEKAFEAKLKRGMADEHKADAEADMQDDPSPQRRGEC